MVSADKLNVFNQILMYQGLPRLISESDPNAQAINIERLIENYFNIDGLAISVLTEDTIVNYSHQKTIDTTLIEKLDSALFDNSKATAVTADNGLAFICDNGEIVPSSGNGQPPKIPPGACGLAFDLSTADFIGGMYLLTNTHTAALFTADMSKTRQFIALIASLVSNAHRHFQSAEKMRFFSLYETVSSSLGYVGDLQELLTTIIGIVTMELPSEEGSVLLLDEETNELEFFSAIGDTGFGLTQMRFPADKGIAGKALTTRQPLIVNNVQTCPYFFGKIDEQADFQTRSILAAPLISGEECIGVIEAINKVGQDCFDDQDKRILMSIADEVALAVKNSRLFDYVVDSYCNIRRGEMTCKGCRRPLKSWTPCAKQLDKV